MFSAGGPLEKQPDVTISFTEVSGENTNSVSTLDPPMPLWLGETMSHTPLPEDIVINVQSMSNQGPQGSVLQTMGNSLESTVIQFQSELEEGRVHDQPQSDIDPDHALQEQRGEKEEGMPSIGELLVGISGSKLKENFNAAMEKDKEIQSKPLRYLKGGARITGIALGMVLNFSSRIISTAIGIAATGVLLGGFSITALFTQEDSMLWKNPRSTLALSVGIGAAFGAGCGAIVGTLGNLLVRGSLEYDSTEDKDLNAIIKDLGKDIEESFTHNIAVGIHTSMAGLALAIVNPLCWRAAWVKGEDF